MEAYTLELLKRPSPGMEDAVVRHPFAQVCENTGKPLSREDAVIDELEPGNGEVRWLCPKCMGVGEQSCG